MSSQENLVLYAATYADGDSARADFDDLKAAEGPDLVVAAAIVMSRDANGRVDVLGVGDGDTAAGAPSRTRRRRTRPSRPAGTT